MLRLRRGKRLRVIMTWMSSLALIRLVRVLLLLRAVLRERFKVGKKGKRVRLLNQTPL